MIEAGRYNKKVYWNDWIDKTLVKVFSYEKPIRYSYHAYERWQTEKRRHKCMDAITEKSFTKDDVCEVIVRNGFLSEFLVRFKYDRSYDIVMAFRVQKDCFYCKTFWFNKKHDHHDTLDADLYVKA